MNDNPAIDLSGEFENRNYKSCFARSMAVNSQQKHPKFSDFKGTGLADAGAKTDSDAGRRYAFQSKENDEVKFRRSLRNTTDESRRYSCGNLYSSIRRTSNRITEIPVENMVNQLKLDTLEWQLKEIQKSREMYRAVMKQIVTYLEKAHHSLKLLGSRTNRRNSVQRSKSEHFMELSRISDTSTISNNPSRTLDEHKIKDLQWQQSKPEEPSPDEIPPEKLAHEAFRLLRTAQSLLNTREPDLAQVPSCQPANDIEFLEQLAKEFPPPEAKPQPQRATSFSLSPKLIVPEAESKISTAFNRKLSLQLSDVRRTTSRISRSADSTRGSVAESDTDPSNEIGLFCTRAKVKSDKSNSPGAGSISSVEDESGFSSMNSFQEIGLPLVNSLMTEEVSTKKALLRSMLQNNSLNYSLGENGPAEAKEEQKSVDNIKLWQKPGNVAASTPPQHRRWSSTPIKEVDPQSLKVLWV
ncbi:unnamed protein product [Phyllotreta striolata]|uniref:Uncharacterized protein n=1 Tax=Phyllotreta striolata TaxID=444603 RepID=A0A9N9TD95_PHYSR|nr:unnamed protein product [Phyllotreta striolata]